MTNADVGEMIRKEFIIGMRQGDKLCLDIEASRPDFPAMNQEGTFIAENFFNFEHMKVETNYMPYVRENENHGVGGVNPGFGYNRLPNFSMTIRSSAENEEDLMVQVSKIPNFLTDF